MCATGRDVLADGTAHVFVDFTPGDAGDYDIEGPLAWR